MNYSIKYKLKNSLFWKKVKRVKGDLIASDLPIPTRVLILDDESRMEVPLEGTEWLFSKERFIAIKQSMEKELGQKL